MNRCTAVIGACFGDEGKGLVTDAFCAAGRCAVVRHNGGAQAGHTVVNGGRRFIFHQIGSGSFRGADTIWGEDFLPDLYKLGEEYESFRSISGIIPRIFTCCDTKITLIDDVLINMALETSRGDGRHGSCGMGINEAYLRGRAGHGVDMAWLKAHTADELFRQMKEIRHDHTSARLDELGLTLSDIGEYGELLIDDNVLRSAAEQMCVNAELTEFIDDTQLSQYDRIVFEGAQGLLLDSDNSEYYPHVTASRTGLDNLVKFCERHGLTLDSAVYVMRSYVTRHGAGHLPNACPREDLGDITPDKTNVPNPWQGGIRYAPHTSPEYLLSWIKRDLNERTPASVGLAVTHLNETADTVRFCSGDIPFAALRKHRLFAEIFDRFYGSYAEDLLLSAEYDK